MKKILLLFSIVFMGLILFSQEIKEEASVINIEVPVRVFNGDTFVDNLTIDDFEVLENGIPQKIEAVYFVKKRSVERSQERKRFAPKTARSYFLFFELTDNDPRIADAINYFAHNVLTPGDNLAIVTSMKSYKMKNIAFEVSSRDEIARQLIKLIRRDTLMGNSEYRNLVKELSALAGSLSTQMRMVQVPDVAQEGSFDNISQPITDMSSGSLLEGRTLEEQLNLYENFMLRLDNLRKVNQQTLLEFAQYLSQQEGQKYVTIFYQKEFIPQIDPKLLNQTMSLYQDRPLILQAISNMIDFYKREIPIDVELIKQTYSDCSISIHFLYITRTPDREYGLHMEDHTEDIFAAFREMAIATGGFIDSSSMADFLFKRAVEAIENYYLVYYSPVNYSSDGKFKEINVRIKNKDYRIFHRAGYFAN
jgi:VWFA-related protein